MLSKKTKGAEPTDEEVRSFLNDFHTGSTTQRHKCAVRQYYHYKKRAWPFRAREFKAAEKALPEYLSRNEINKIVAVARDMHEYMFIKTLFFSGMRIGELMELTGSNIMESGIRFFGKGNKERVVPITDEEFMKQLKDYAKRLKGSYLFPYSYNLYWKLLKTMCKRAGVKEVSPHKIRHSRAIDLMRKGAELPVVQSFLGHEKPDVTMIYLGLTNQDIERRLKEIDK